MQVTIASRHMEVTQPLRDYAEQKANKLTKYYDRIQGIEVVFEAVKGDIRVEMIILCDHKHRFLAHCDEADAYAGVDGCFAKLERQLSEYKQKFRNRKHIGEDKRE